MATRWVLEGPTKLMLGSVLIASTYSLVVDVGLGTEGDPWVFQVGAMSGKLISILLYLVLAHPEFRQREVATLLLRRAFGWLAFWRLAGDSLERKRQRRSALWILASGYSQFSITCFVWSTRFVDTAVSAIIVGAFPALFVVLMGRQDRALGGSGRYRSLTKVDGVTMTLAFAGMATVAWGAAAVVDLEGALWRTLAGVFLAAAATTGGLLSAKSFKWGVFRARETGITGVGSESALVLVSYAAGTLLALPLIAGMAVATGWRMSNAGFGAALACGLVVMFPANILFIRANLSTRRLSVNNLIYAEMLFSLLWLWMFTSIDVGSPALVLAGAATVVVANVLSAGVGEWMVGKAKRRRRGDPVHP
ncbi:MAG: hypothetical protein OXI56_00195 [bacterium]|nr:hypothetical protein [bacterium]MDE0600196.1 hypothetical protein [bacterium]